MIAGVLIIATLIAVMVGALGEVLLGIGKLLDEILESHDRERD